MEPKYTILAIGAHPDDVELGTFGTLIKWSKNTRITIAIASNGEAGGAKEGQRIEEAKRSALAIGSNIIFLGLKDGFIPHDLNTVSLLDKVIQKVQPDMILLHHPDDLHQDHRHLSLSGISAGRRVKQLLFYETPSTTRNFNPNFYVNISDEIQQKYDILCKYESQAQKSYLSRQSIFGTAAYHAQSISKLNAHYEAFQLFRNIVD